MKAYIVTSDNQTIEPIDVSSLDDIRTLIGFETLESDEIDKNGDRLFFDEECFLRGTSGRFQIDKIIPVSGIGVVVGVKDDETTLTDVITCINDVRKRVKFL